MPGKLIVGTIETQNINFDSDTTGMTINSSGVVTTPKKAGMYEHITTKVSTTNSELSGATAASIRFQDVFTTDYIAYKLVIGFYGSAHTSGAHDITMRWMNGSSEVTAANYRWHTQEYSVNTSSYIGNHNNGDDRMRLFRNLNDNDGSSDDTGLYGEIDMYGVIAPVVNGVNTDRGDVYRPMMKSDIVGYNETLGAYIRSSSFGRYNGAQPDTAMTGFAFMGETGELAGTHMSLFGLRVNA
tara:strand:+ start:88 stop:810 length:723 start_codon:yes stop_codon:yes gene_type:complete